MSFARSDVAAASGHRPQTAVYKSAVAAIER